MSFMQFQYIYHLNNQMNFEEDVFLKITDTPILYVCIDINLAAFMLNMAKIQVDYSQMQETQLINRKSVVLYIFLNPGLIIIF